MQTIVVGVDGSEESKAALRWALDEGRLRSASVRAIYAWAFPHMATWPGSVAPAQVNIDALQHDAEEFLASAWAKHPVHSRSERFIRRPHEASRTSTTC